MSPLIYLNNASIQHQHQVVLDQVNLSIYPGEWVFVIGETGSGKSALIKTLCAALPLQAGEGVVFQFDLRRLSPREMVQLRRKLGIALQEFHLLQDRNVGDNLDFALQAIGWKKKTMRTKRLMELLEQVGLATRLNQFPHQLSTGEQQRLVLARALLNAPPLLLVDEPTGNLDPATSETIFNLLKQINQAGTTIMMATHDMTFWNHQPSRVLHCATGHLQAALHPQS